MCNGLAQYFPHWLFQPEGEKHSRKSLKDTVAITWRDCLVGGVSLLFELLAVPSSVCTLPLFPVPHFNEDHTPPDQGRCQAAPGRLLENGVPDEPTMHGDQLHAGSRDCFIVCQVQVRTCSASTLKHFLYNHLCTDQPSTSP